MLLPIPLRPAERSILFSEKSVRLFDDARSAASSHAPKKGCVVREVWRSQTCTSGSLFFCLLFFGEAKKSKCPVGTRRMVKVTPQANHKAPTPFQAAYTPSIGSLKHHSTRQKQKRRQSNRLAQNPYNCLLRFPRFSFATPLRYAGCPERPKYNTPPHHRPRIGRATFAAYRAWFAAWRFFG